MAATHTTAGIKIAYKNGDKTFSRTLNGMNADTISDTEVASAFATSYSKLVDGTITAVDYTVTKPVDIG